MLQAAISGIELMLYECKRVGCGWLGCGYVTQSNLLSTVLALVTNLMNVVP